MNSKDTRVFINRELSWIAFNERVLELAEDKDVPLLERAKFLSITASNFDEFFMVRVGELTLLVDEGIEKKDHAGMTPRQQLIEIGRRAHAFAVRQARCFDSLMQLLGRAGIRRLRPSGLSADQARHAQETFTGEILPVLSPLSVPSTHGFPLLAGNTLHLAVQRQGGRPGAAPRFTVISLPRVLSRIIALPSQGTYDFLLVEDLLVMHVAGLFPGETIVECVPFRVTRNAAMKAEDELAADLLAEMSDMIVRRRKSDCLRLEIRSGASSALLTFLQKGLRLPREAIYQVDDAIDYTFLMRLTQLSGFTGLKDEPWPPLRLLSLKPGMSMFEAIARRDILLHHPYDSFDPFLKFINEAAGDPDVVAIKQTLYRTAKKSAIVAALARAAENGKYVTAIVELKARFDEERNISWAQELEDAGVQVIYGIKRYKTHAKACLVIRKEAGGIRRYAHFGTGNYNEVTSQLYTDVGLFTCDDDLTADLSAFFNVITGQSQPSRFRKIAASPIDLRERVLDLIEAEAAAAKRGRAAFIRAKLNALVDARIIRALCEASAAGVRISLNVRGICCLRPGVRGYTENITVSGIVDRFLEHSRIFHFHGGGGDKIFISSADWMPRNLDKRCELFTPVEDPRCRKRCIEILDASFRDNAHSWSLRNDGTYARSSPGGRKSLRCQEALYRRACAEAEERRRSRRTEFETHRPPDKS